MKLKDFCKGCRKIKWFARIRQINTSIGTVTSKDPLCGSCYKNVAKNIAK